MKLTKDESFSFRMTIVTMKSILNHSFQNGFEEHMENLKKLEALLEEEFRERIREEVEEK